MHGLQRRDSALSDSLMTSMPVSVEENPISFQMNGAALSSEHFTTITYISFMQDISTLTFTQKIQFLLTFTNEENIKIKHN
jgi:hypothetical protein